MRRETIEVGIAPGGEVHVEVKGMRGPACLDVRELFRSLLGPIKATAFSEEYYEPEKKQDLRKAAG